jgi:hypothetical protein
VGLCDGAVHAWTATAVPDSGSCTGGRAATVAVAQGCVDFLCNGSTVEQTVLLGGSGSRRS